MKSNETNIQISFINIKLKENYKNLKATVNIIINNIIAINEIQILSHKDNLFINMPFEKKFDGNYYPIVSFLNKEDKKYLTKIILNEYFNELNKNKGVR